MVKNKISDHVIIILIILVGVTILTVIGGLTSLKEVTNYDECVAAGYPVLESYPEQCTTPTGETFVREVFCGISTYSHCNVGSGCKVTGCSGEVCQGANEEELMTTCDYQECYDIPGYECKCVSGQCQWTNQ